MAVTRTEHATREEWLEARNGNGTAGASDVPNILGYGWQTPLHVWSVMTGKIEPFQGNEATQLGHALQPVIRDRYISETGRKTLDLGDFTIHYNTDYPFLHATLDYGICAVEHQGEPGASPPIQWHADANLECKNVGWRLVDHWADGAPLYVQMQFQAQLAVCGMDWGSVAALLGGSQFAYVDYERNQRFIDWMVDRVAAFMELVRRDIPPAARGADLDTLKRLFPRHSPGVSVSLPGSLIDIADTLEADKAERKRLDGRIKDAEAKIKQAIGEAQTGVLPDGAAYVSTRIDIKETKPREYTRWTLTRKERA